MAWQDDKAQINAWYEKYLGRPLSDSEWTEIWDPQLKGVGIRNFDESNIRESDEAGRYNDAKTRLGSPDIHYDPVRQDYVLDATNLQPGETEAPPPPGQPIDTTPSDAEVDALTAKQLPGVLSAVKGAASQRGGLDTGGYLTSVGKGAASTWMDAYNAIQGGKQFDSTVNLQRQAGIDARKLQKEGYATQAAMMKSQQPSPWDYLLQLGGAVYPWMQIFNPSTYGNTKKKV